MKQIRLVINAAGCETTCSHCWANGGRYKNMSFDDIQLVVNLFKDFAGNNGYNLGFSVMHELLAHQDAVRIVQLKNEQNKDNPYYHAHQIPTSGIPIAIREDYKELLDGLVENKVTNLHFALHGMGATHDTAVNCKDAFEKLTISIERTKAAGMICTFVVYLNKTSIYQLKEIKKFLFNYEIKPSFMIARYISGKRLRKYDEIRVEYSDIVSNWEEMCELYPDVNIEAYKNSTEAAFYEKAIQGKDVTTEADIQGDTINLVCDKDFNIYDGSANVLTKCYGNLKENAVEVFEKLNDDIINNSMEYVFSPALFYPNEIIPPLKELAEKYGDKNGQKVYLAGIYYKWLDNAFLK